LATLACSFALLSQNAEAAELPAFFENMAVRYNCSANVKMLNGSVVFNITCQYIDTVVEMNENASIKLVFTVISMNGALPAEVSDVFFPFALESKNTTIEVTQQTQSHYWSIFMDEDLFADYKTRGYFLGEENFDTDFGTVGTYHVRRVAAYQTYDVFYDKATGWVVYMKETYGGWQVSNYTVTYSIEMAETNASLSPPLPSTFPYSYLLIAGILLAIAGVASVFYFRRKSKQNITAQSTGKANTQLLLFPP
jgi:hypothetical protein